MTKLNIKFIFSLISEENLTFFNGLYDKPWTRLSPYIFGICIGYIIHKIETKLEISIEMMACGMLPWDLHDILLDENCMFYFRYFSTTILF